MDEFVGVIDNEIAHSAEEKLDKDELIDKILSVKRPATALMNIDKLLKSAYQSPREFVFSADEDERAVQKAVLYHRIRENASLRTGEKSEENDAEYERLASAVTEGRDIVVKHIRSRSPQEQVELLVELMTSDTRKPWFEDMLTRAEEKRAQSEKALNRWRDGIRSKGEARMWWGKREVQSELFQSLAENRGGDTKQFFERTGNIARVKRLLAIELHRRQVEHELEELRKAYGYESEKTRAELIEQRQSFLFEKAADENAEAHLAKLENSQEVLAVLYRMAQCSSLEELSRLIINPPSPEYLRQHENISLMEEKLIPDAIIAFLESDEAPEEESKEEKKLLELSAMKGEGFPEKPTAEDCEKRIKEYGDVLKTLEKAGLLSGENGKKLKQELKDQIDRLEDVVRAPARENIKFNFRADTLIDYYDPSDPTHRPMDAIEAREKLLHGAELEQKSFEDGEFIGVSQKISYDKKTGLINKGPEKLITRVMNLSEKAGKKPELQLEELRKIKDVLKQTDPFYLKNSENYNNVLASLNKVIKAQETLDKDANVRQVAELRALYAELDSNAAKYVKDKSDRLKKGDDRAQIRMDAIKTLQSLTGEKHVGKVALKLYDEQHKFEDQKRMAEPCKALMNKWKNAGTPKTPEQLAQFKSDFELLSSRFEFLKNTQAEQTYFKISISESLDDFTKKAKVVQDKLAPGDKLDAKKLNDMNNLRIESNDARLEFYALDPTIAPKKAEKKKEPPQKVNPSKAMAPV